MHEDKRKRLEAKGFRVGTAAELLALSPEEEEYIELKLGSALDPMVAWQLQRGSGVYADVIACRASEFREDLDTVNTLSYSAVKEGLLIYQRVPARRKDKHSTINSTSR